MPVGLQVTWKSARSPAHEPHCTALARCTPRLPFSPLVSSSAGEHGDLHVVLRTQPHPTFERRGDGLLANVTISLLDALVGFEREVSC